MSNRNFQPASVNTRIHSRPEVSVVVPAYNEAVVIEQTYRRLTEVLSRCCKSHEIVFVDDGSTDDTPTILESLAANSSAITLVSLSRNFGKELALTAGLDYSSGDAIIVIDADLQDPPDCIPDMLDEWRKGYDMVTMRRRRRAGESVLKRASAWAYYRLLNRISDVPIPPETGDFRLLSRRAVDAIGQFGETQRYMKGLFAWIGYPQKELLYDRLGRAGGQSKWGYLALWRLAVDGITSFSTVPLRLATYVGSVAALFAFSYGFFVLVKTLIFGEPVSGYPTLILTVLGLGGMQLLAIGVLGEYVGRLFVESKRRPKYLVQSHRQSYATQDSTEIARRSRG